MRFLVLAENNTFIEIVQKEADQIKCQALSSVQNEENITYFHRMA